MRFKNINEFIEYVNASEYNLNDFDISFAKIEEPVVENVITEGSVGINSFSDSPQIKVQLNELVEENILFVESYESVPLSCSTGKVSVMGRTVYLNVCESEADNPVIYLNISLNETVYSRVPFKLKSSGSKTSDYIMILNPKSLLSNE